MISELDSRMNEQVASECILQINRRQKNILDQQFPMQEPS